MEQHRIENYSGLQRTFVKGVRVIKKRDYFVQEVTLTGDAPKRFISIYNYSGSNAWRRKNKQHWTQYIAKTGHKWYPNESIKSIYLINLERSLASKWPNPIWLSSIIILPIGLFLTIKATKN